MATETILKVSNLTKQYGGVRAMDNLGFDLNKGDFMGVIGPNGSGKTTLVNLITGFVKPDKGEIDYRGEKIAGSPPHKIANLGIARTFQMVKPFQHMEAYKNLIIPLCSPRAKKHGDSMYGQKGNLAIDLLGKVGFKRNSKIPYTTAGNLSHGYLKRMELARCMALKPDIIILDELFSGMSMSEVAGTIPILKDLRDQGITMIVIEHRLKELFRIANRVIVLNFGQKIADGTPKEVMQEEAVKKAYLGSEVE
jgi:branched-chain amino acid transport system ATP-binding protein